MHDTVIYVLQFVAVVSVSVSATLLAIKKRMDIIGTAVLALIASFGGGILRDVFIGNLPISLISNASYRLLIGFCLSTVFVLFHVGFIPKAREGLLKKTREFWFDLTDAIGLAAFAVAGADVASVMGQKPAVQIFCGCLTGVGGGILRDMIASEIPLIFRKHIYLLPVILGSTAYVWLKPTCGDAVAVGLGFLIIVGLRVLAIRFLWNLPTPLTAEERKNRERKKEETKETEISV